MKTEESAPPAANPSPRNKGLFGAAVAFAVMGTALLLKLFVFHDWKPQLNIKNTGTTSVQISLNGNAVITDPGQVWSGRFRGGDTLTIVAANKPGAQPLTINLPARNPKKGDISQRWSAEVNADDPKQVRLENRFFEEISDPPHPREPWP